MNSFKFTLKNLRRQPLAEISVAVPIGLRDMRRKAVERSLRSAFGGRFSRLAAPPAPLRLVVLATGNGSGINQAEAETVLVPIPKNGDVRVVTGPLDDASRSALVTGYRLRDLNVVVSPSRGELHDTVVQSLTTWLAAA